MAIELREKPLKPFLRWAGGKAWFHQHLVDLLGNHEFDNYYEPFLGGGSIFFSLNATEAVLSDANAELIEAYIAVRDHPEEVIETFLTYRNEKDFYYNLRAQIPDDPNARAARFIYLNRTSYNGLYRVNRQGQYNVPFGNKPSIGINEGTIRSASEGLQNAVLVSGDFEDGIEHIRENTLVFLDPPYTVSHNHNGFIAYNQDIFSIEDQQRLANFIHQIDEVGAYYILTNAAHDAIRNIFRDCGRSFIVERQSLIGGRNAQRGLTEELVFTNIDV